MNPSELLSKNTQKKVFKCLKWTLRLKMSNMPQNVAYIFVPFL